LYCQIYFISFVGVNTTSPYCMLGGVTLNN